MELGKYKLAMRPKKYLTREFVVYKEAPEAMDDVITEEQNIIDTMPSQAPVIDNYMPEIPGMEDPSLRQVELADGGVVQREGFRIGGEALIKAYNLLKQKLGRAPSVSEMQEKTKTYRNTILKELPDYDFTDLRTLEQPAEVGAARQEGIQKSLEQKAKEKYKNKPYVRFLGGKRGQSTSKVSEVVFPNEALEEKYLNFLLEKYSYPGSSPSNPITNEFLSKQFNISPYTIDRINGFYKKQLNLQYPKGKSKLETTQKRNENLKKSRLYLGGKKYQNINKSQEQIKIIQNNYYKNNPKEILKNKNLIDLLNLKLVNGKIISKNKTEKELLDITQSERGVFDIDHISEVQDAKINTEYPINRQWIPYNTNSGFVKSIRTYVDKNPDDVEGIKEIEKVLEKFNIRVKTNKGIIGPKEIPAVDETNNIMPNFLKNLQIYGAKIPEKQLQQYQKQLPGVAGKAAATGATTLALTTLANAETPDAVIPEQGGLNKTQAGVLAGAGTVATKTGRKILGKILDVVGTPLTVPLSAAGIGKALDPEKSYGEHLKETVTDPYFVSGTGFLMKPTVESSKNIANLVSKFSPAAGKVLEKGLNIGMNPNVLSKFGTNVLGPVAGLYAAGKELYDLYSKNKDYLDSLTQEERDQISLNYLDETTMDVFKYPSSGEYIGGNIPTTEDVINKYAYGGRVNFKKGSDPKDKAILPINPMMDEGPQDPSKRTFIQGAGGVGLAGLLLGTGLLKLGKSATVSSKIGSMVKDTTAPSWMEALITKVMKEGKDLSKKEPGTYIDRSTYSTVSKDKILVKELEFKNPDTGKMEIIRLRADEPRDTIYVDYIGDNTLAGQGVTFKLSPKQKIVDKGNYLTSEKVKGEYQFSAHEAEPRVVNWDGDIEFDGETGVRTIIDLNSDISGLKSFVTGGKGVDKKVAKIKRETVDKIEKNPAEYIEDTYDANYYDPSLPD
jgi:hypothetical protein